MTAQLLSDSADLKKQPGADGFALPPQETVEKLNEAAMKKLAEIVRRYGAKEQLWQGYNADEIAVARELLDKSSSTVVR